MTYGCRLYTTTPVGGGGAKNELLFQKGMNFNEVPNWQKRGIQALNHSSIISIERFLRVGRDKRHYLIVVEVVGPLGQRVGQIRRLLTGGFDELTYLVDIQGVNRLV